MLLIEKFGHCIFVQEEEEVKFLPASLSTKRICTFVLTVTLAVSLLFIYFCNNFKKKEVFYLHVYEDYMTFKQYGFCLCLITILK